MTIIVNRRGILGDVETEAARLESLTEDFIRLAGGDRPSDRNIDQAPLIDGWSFAVRPVPCLVGQMHGHPDCRGPISITSGLWAWAPELGWARTLSRFYRLGRPLNSGRPQ